MKVSVIIPISEKVKHIKTLDYLQQLNYPCNQIEIIVVKGSNPGRQRNAAVNYANGDLLCFFDDDLIFDKNILSKAVHYFKDSEICGMGGPSLIEKGGNFFQQMVGIVYASFFGTWDVRYRHKAIGNKVIAANEAMLILCNFLIQRDVFLKEGGFDRRFFANEENEFMNRLILKGYRLLYNPNLKVYRSYRKNIWEFMKGICRDARGRVDHYFAVPKFIQLKFFIPFLFELYLVSLIFIYPFWYFLPIFIYTILLFVVSCCEALIRRNLKAFFYLIVLFPVMHIAYGTGSGYGLLKNILKAKYPVKDTPKITMHKKFADPWPKINHF
ncbi:MAG: glycosyltransferase [Candidatus Omnitrophota bacterium]